MTHIKYAKNILILIFFPYLLLGCDIQKLTGTLGNSSDSSTSNNPKSIVIVKPYKASINTLAKVSLKALNSLDQVDTSFSGTIYVATNGATQAGQDATFVDGVAQIGVSRTTPGVVSLNLVSSLEETDTSSTDAITFETGGVLYEGFSEDGKYYKSMYDAYSSGVDIARQGSSEYIVVYNTSFNYGYEKIAVVRYLANGQRDTTFGSSGIKYLEFGDVEFVKAKSIAIQTDNKILISGTYFSGTQKDAFLIRLTEDGDYDSSFNGDGLITTDVGGLDNWGYEIALFSNGNIVQIGSANNGSDWDISVFMFDSNGDPVNSFDADGVLLVDLGQDESGKSVININDTHILIGGYSDNNIGSTSVSSFVVAKLDLTGAPDNTFDGDGVYSNNVSGGEDRISKVKLMGDGTGRILAAGINGGQETSGLPLVLILSSNGVPDTTFNGTGIFAFVSPVIANVNDIAHDPINSRIYLIGNHWSAGDLHNFSVWKMDETGSLDASYGNVSPGLFYLNFFNNNDAINAALLEPSGEIIFTGEVGMDKIMADKGTIGKINNQGNGLVSTFAEDGLHFEIQIGESLDFVKDFFFQSDKSIITYGYSLGWGYAGNNITTAKMNSLGESDTTYGYFGTYSINKVGNFDTPSNAVQLDTGQVIFAGTIYSGGNKCGVYKLNTDGSLDETFNSSTGVLMLSAINIIGCEEITQTSSGEIYIALTHSVGGDYDIGIAKINSNGDLDTSFNTDGLATYTNGSNDEYVEGIHILSNGKIMLLGDDNSGQMVARFNADGTIDTTYDGDGKYSVGISGDIWNSILLADGSIIAVGGTSANRASIFKLDPSGVLDTTFGTAGFVFWQQGYGADIARSVLEDSDGSIYVTGETVSDDVDKDIFLLKLNSDGSFDNNFGTNGVRVFVNDFTDENVSKIKQDADNFLYVLGWESFLNTTSQGNFLYKLSP